MMLSQVSLMAGGSGSPMKLKDLCRMCASPCNRPVHIFGTQGVENELALKFNSYLPVKVAESDTLPLQFCYECTNQLIQWDASVLVAIAADKKLRALQWREQQSQHTQHSSTEIIDKNLPPPECATKRKPSSGDLVCCSICKRGGMEFRQLVEHLKTHKMPIENKNEMERRNSWHQSNSTGSNSTEEEERNKLGQLVGAELRPVVHLETLDATKELHSKNSNSESKAEESNKSIKLKNQSTMKKKILLAKRPLVEPDGKSPVAFIEVGSGDPVVTSSTSTLLSKPSENSEGENLHAMASVCADAGTKSPLKKSSTAITDNKISTAESQDQNVAFKPKVRIISAESINQTLEERAKANQNAKNLESPNCDGQSGPASVAIPSAPLPISPKPTSASKVQRLILSSEMIQKLNSNSMPGPKLFKLADGRIIRLLDSIPKLSSKASQLTVSEQQDTPKVVLNPKTAMSPKSPDPECRLSANPAKAPLENQSKTNHEMISKSAPLKYNIEISNSRIIAFNLQPGPKNSANRFTCDFCGRRNLSQEQLQDHAQQHTPPKDVSLVNVKEPVPPPVPEQC